MTEPCEIVFSSDTKARKDWRTIYYKKYPNAPRIEFEDVLIMEKVNERI